MNITRVRFIIRLEFVTKITIIRRQVVGIRCARVLLHFLTTADERRLFLIMWSVVREMRTLTTHIVPYGTAVHSPVLLPEFM